MYNKYKRYLNKMPDNLKTLYYKGGNEPKPAVNPE